jgi:membrane protein implicated in regulation of membrane protease activity
MTLGAELFAVLIQRAVTTGGDEMAGVDWSAWVVQQGVPFTILAGVIYAILKGMFVLKRETEIRDENLAKSEARCTAEMTALVERHEKELAQVRLDYQRWLTEAESRRTEMAAAFLSQLAEWRLTAKQWEGLALETMADMRARLAETAEVRRGPGP